MNIKDIRYFLAVVDNNHFGKAAKKCNISQPTLSEQIKKMEKKLGVTLFERDNRSVMLTEIGHNIVPLARKIIREVDEIYAIASIKKDPFAGKYKIGAFPTLSTYLFPSLVNNVREVMPNLNLILYDDKTDRLLEMLRFGHIDAAFLSLPIREDSLISQELFEDEFFLAVKKNHELAKLEDISIDMLKEYNLLLLEEGHCLRDNALDVCQKFGIEEMEFKATGLETLREMVKAGSGITFMPKIAIKENEENIKYLKFKDPVPKRKIGLVWRKNTARIKVINKIIDLF